MTLHISDHKKQEQFGTFLHKLQLQYNLILLKYCIVNRSEPCCTVLLGPDPTSLQSLEVLPLTSVGTGPGSWSPEQT